MHEEINNSSVINKDEVDLFINWLERKPTRKKFLNSKTDGDSIDTFYSKCSNKFPFLLKQQKVADSEDIAQWVGKIKMVNLSKTCIVLFFH